MSRDCWMPPRSWYPATRTMDLAPPFAIPASMADSSGNPMGPCCESTNSQSYPLCANCSATVGLCEFRNKPSLGCPSRSCFLNSAPLSASLIRSCLLDFGQAPVTIEANLHEVYNVGDLRFGNFQPPDSA